MQANCNLLMANKKEIHKDVFTPEALKRAAHQLSQYRDEVERGCSPHITGKPFSGGPYLLDEIFVEKLKNPKNVKQGKKNKVSGSIFEKKTREDLESKGWIVSKFQNTVEFTKKKEVFGISQISSLDARLIHAKNHFFGPGKPIMLGAGFPDFIAFRRKDLGGGIYDFCYDVIGVEAKTNGKLSAIEKKKCKFLLEKRIFNRILIASKKKIGRKVVVEYTELKMQELG